MMESSPSIIYFVGEVFDYLVAHGRMKEKEARSKFRQVITRQLGFLTLAFLTMTVIL